MVRQEPLNSVADAAEGSVDVGMAQLPSCLVHHAGSVDLRRCNIQSVRHRLWLWCWGAASTVSTIGTTCRVDILYSHAPGYRYRCSAERCMTHHEIWGGRGEGGALP